MAERRDTGTSATGPAPDARWEESRRFEAYLRRRRLVGGAYWAVGREEMDAHWEKCMSDPAATPIPVTDPGWLYHGTATARLRSIAVDGLAPQERSRWAKDGYAGHARGRVFFTTTVSSAEFYAKEASKAHPAILRVAAADLADMEPDGREVEGTCFHVSRAVPPELVQAWRGKGWLPLAGRDPAPVVALSSARARR